MLRDEILEEIRDIPVVDAHAHVIGHFQCQPMESVIDLLMEPYIGFAMPFASRSAAAIIQDRERPDIDRWTAFADVWPAWRATGYGQVLSGTLVRWGIESDHLDAGTYPLLLERVRARNPDYSRREYAAAGIEASLTHYLAMPHFGRLQTVADYLSGSLVIEPGFFPQLGSPPLHEYPNKREVAAMGALADIEVTDLDSLCNAVRAVISRCVQKGIVGFKEHRAYSMGLEYGTPDRAAAQRDLDAVLAGETFEFGPLALSDYMFDQVVQNASHHGLPIAVHTGYRQLDVDESSNLVKMSRVFAAYPDVVFDIYHLNYPYFADNLAVVKSFPNVYANTCWTHIIDPAYTVAFLTSAIGAIPGNHVFGFGSDFAVLPEAAVAHLEIARTNIAEALAWAIERRSISRHAAIELARMWLRDNPRDVYRLPPPLER